MTLLQDQRKKNSTLSLSPALLILFLLRVSRMCGLCTYALLASKIRIKDGSRTAELFEASGKWTMCKAIALGYNRRDCGKGSKYHCLSVTIFRLEQRPFNS